MFQILIYLVLEKTLFQILLNLDLEQNLFQSLLNLYLEQKLDPNLDPIIPMSLLESLNLFYFLAELSVRLTKPSCSGADNSSDQLPPGSLPEVCSGHHEASQPGGEQAVRGSLPAAQQGGVRAAELSQ